MTLFTVSDPQGIEVHCESGQWKEHVLENRPFMSGWENEAEQVIQQPNAIFRDASFSNRRCYYRLRGNGRSYLKVVTEQVAEKRHRLITSFPTDAPKQGETILWIEN